MINGKKILAIIPARAGSKGLPTKNKKKLMNKPLICYSIEAAINCKEVDGVYVSTDDPEILNISNSYNIIKSELRPKELAEDHSSMTDVINYTVNKLNEKSETYQYILLLQPTSPLRKTEDISNVINKSLEENLKSIVSVCEVEHSPLWSNTLPENLSLKEFIREEVKNVPRQKLPKYYRLNGAIYFSEIEYFKTNNGFLGNESYAYVMPQIRSIDIDTNIDFQLAELIMKEEQENNGN